LTSRTESQSQAAVFHGPETPLELRTFALPVLQAGEVLVKIRCATICGSDRHTLQGHRPVSGPTVLGHEIIGTIAELASAGPAVCDLLGSPLKIGDRVTWSVAAACGRCFFCAHDLPQKCESLFKYGHETIERSPLSGGLAEFCHLRRGTAIVQVPNSLTDHVACPANCATATVVAAMQTTGGCAGKSILIHGAGMLGLTATAMAAMQSARCIVVTDVSSERLARAKAFGATHTALAAENVEVLKPLVQEITANRGIDLALELSGATTAVEQSVELLRTGGRLVLVGAVFPTRAAQLFPEQIVRKLLTINGIHNYRPHDLANAITFLHKAAAMYPFASLVDDEISLKEIAILHGKGTTNRAIRTAIRPQ